MRTRKGQGLSLNVIIIAALALIVLVVLVMVFTGRIGIFSKGINREGESTLIQMRVQYGDCRPSVTEEDAFRNRLAQAESTVEEDEYKRDFQEEIDRCKAVSSKDSCESTGCRWR